GDLIVDRRADEDDAVLEQPREDVVGPLAAVGLLHDHRHQLQTRIRKLMRHNGQIAVIVGENREAGPCDAASDYSTVLFRVSARPQPNMRASLSVAYGFTSGSVEVARAMTKSIDFSRRSPAATRDSPPSFSSPAR